MQHMLQSMRRLPCEFPACERTSAPPGQMDRRLKSDLALCVEHSQLLAHDADRFRNRWDAAASRSRPAP